MKFAILALMLVFTSVAHAGLADIYESFNLDLKDNRSQEEKDETGSIELRVRAECSIYHGSIWKDLWEQKSTGISEACGNQTVQIELNKDGPTTIPRFKKFHNTSALNFDLKPELIIKNKKGKVIAEIAVNLYPNKKDKKNEIYLYSVNALQGLKLKKGVSFHMDLFVPRVGSARSNSIQQPTFMTNTPAIDAYRPDENLIVKTSVWVSLKIDGSDVYFKKSADLSFAEISAFTEQFLRENDLLDE